MTDTAIAEIEDLENRRWAAQIEGDVDALAILLADELTYTHSNGLVDTKQSYIKAIENKVFDYQNEKRSDVAVQVFDDMALATGRIEISVKAGGKVLALLARYSAVWLRRDGQWQFLAWQSTPLAA